MVNIFVVEQMGDNDVSCELKVTYNLEEALQSAKHNFEHLSKYDKKHNTIAVKGYDLDIDTNKDAKKEFNRVVENMSWYPDAYYYYEISINGEREI